MRLTPITGRRQPGAPYRAPPVCRSIGMHSRYYPDTNRYCAGNGILLRWRLSPRSPRPIRGNSTSHYGHQQRPLCSWCNGFVIRLSSGAGWRALMLTSALPQGFNPYYDRSNHLAIGRWPQRRLRLSTKLPHSIVPLSFRVFIPRISSQATTPAGTGTKIHR